MGGANTHTGGANSHGFDERVGGGGVAYQSDGSVFSAEPAQHEQPTPESIKWGQTKESVGRTTGVRGRTNKWGVNHSGWVEPQPGSNRSLPTRHHIPTNH